MQLTHWPIAVLVLIILSPGAARAQSPKGLDDTVVLHAPFMHFDYAYPYAYSEDHKKESGKQMGGADRPSANPCADTPISGMDMRHDFRILMLKLYFTGCASKDPGPEDIQAVATNSLVETLSELDKPLIGSGMEYTIAGYPAFAISGSTKIKHAVPKNHEVFAATACVLYDKGLACWRFVSDSCEALATMGAYPVTSWGEQASPVLPPKLVLSCKP